MDDIQCKNFKKGFEGMALAMSLIREVYQTDSDKTQEYLNYIEMNLRDMKRAVNFNSFEEKEKIKEKSNIRILNDKINDLEEQLAKSSDLNMAMVSNYFKKYCEHLSYEKLTKYGYSKIHFEQHGNLRVELTFTIKDKVSTNYRRFDNDEELKQEQDKLDETISHFKKIFDIEYESENSSNLDLVFNEKNQQAIKKELSSIFDEPLNNFSFETQSYNIKYIKKVSFSIEFSTSPFALLQR